MTPGSVSDLKAMLTGLDPELSSRAWCFHLLDEDGLIPQTAFAVIREAEGTCAILPAEAAPDDAPQFAKITLRIHSDLEAVGLTSAVSNTLAMSGIACNVVAALNHDHLLVPWDHRHKALQLVEKLSLDARR
ncbi:hypothetical protein NAP1_15723 [Erythrobacter sp. NAP1]|uniref:ACT domain-containing protein n=1 Tax=Erythrobacter sp. NAP1 TaxID=237727 RepID=UPI0000687998|nr:ACT domain-containing protein [Erythrobacter sp. NAP1]EAQ29062.1 hypothetical protein NAP1_15723 [Erythrobacter sp. NAP1]